MKFSHKIFFAFIVFVVVAGAGYALTFIEQQLPSFAVPAVLAVLSGILYLLFNRQSSTGQEQSPSETAPTKDPKLQEAYIELAKSKTDIMGRDELLRKYQRVIEQSPASIIITNLEGIIEYVNPYFCQVSGYSCEEVIGQNPRILKSGELPSEEYANLWSTLKEGKTWRGEFHNKHKDGHLYWEFAHISPVKNGNGGITHYIAIKEEVTKRKAINEARKMYAQALHSINDIVTIVNLKGDFIYVNDSFLTAYGYKAEEIKGQSIIQIIDDSKPKKLLKDILKQTLDKGWQGELPTKSKGGHHFTISFRTSTIKDKNGQSTAVIGVSRDLTEEKSLEEIKRRAEMLASVQELAGSVSHEFSQPLQIIYNYISLINMGKLKKEYVNKIEDATKRITGLVEHLGEITHIQKQDYLSSKIIDLKQSSKTGSDASYKKILVVDDEAQILETVTEMLHLSGYACDSAADGLEALQMVGKNSYHLIISDINMPRMSGTELFEKLQAIGFKEAFIFMTGYNLSKETNALMKKIDGLLNKPVDMKKLLSIVENILGKPGTQN